MSLSKEDFKGFDAADAREALLGFDKKAVNRGLAYFNEGRARHIVCESPGQVYAAQVRSEGTHYDVTLNYDSVSRKWISICGCPIAIYCKHAYALLKQLLAVHASLAMPSARPEAEPTFPALDGSGEPKPQTLTFTGVVAKKLGRQLSDAERRFLRNIGTLYQQAAKGGLRYVHELSGLGLPRPAEWWERLELYPSPPKSEAEFWNYLALYLTEKQQPIPDFLAPVTDLDKCSEQMHRHHRRRKIEHWKQSLAHLGEASPGGAPASAGQSPPELRVCFLPGNLLFQWRIAGGPWQAFKRTRLSDFEAKYGKQFSAEASLLWHSYWQRTQMQYSSNFDYRDSWISQEIARWFRQPLLRPLLVNEAGIPLIFHEAPLRWEVLQPGSGEEDYQVRLLKVDGDPAPKSWLVTSSVPTFYLTDSGVFTGPPHEPHLLSPHSATLIPAEAFESAGGLALLSRLHAAPPPRLAARIRNVKLRPGIRAEVKPPWPGQKTDYCLLDVYGASEDGEHVECRVGSHWLPKGKATPASAGQDFVQLDRSAAAALIPPLEQAGFQWEDYSQRWQLRLTKKFPETFVAFLKALPPETRIDLAGEMASFQNAEIAGTIRLEASETETDWFDLRVIVDVKDAALTQEEIKLLLDAKGGWVRLDQKGWRKLQFTLTAEEDQELARLGLTAHELTSEPQRMHAFQLADKAARKFLPEETCAKIERRAAELKARVTPEVPAAIQAELRPYQRDGFHFLAYLSENRFGGILADDMGLGKTLQTLAWLAWLRSLLSGTIDPQSPSPSLVVCPKSVADNWHAEAVKFMPSLKVRVWSASELKDMAANLGSADVHVLNYSQLRSVGEDLARARFQAVILDEGQYIKNPSSQTAQIARQLRSEHRLILSGTPIENRLLDLWSLMNFAMPGVLGNRAEFGRLYDAKDDPFARQRLAARVRPFLIRRTKAQVARDLPDRMEEDLFCELEGEQKTLYRAELKRAQAMLLGVKTAAALNKQRFNFLTSLLRLRQICCHPRLVRPNSKAASAKVEALIETLEPLLEEGQKVLVFSQFVELLDILRDEMKERAWQHWYLAGDTENRGDLVRAFQAAEGAGVFLISLKAGGFGLNLTAASYVVLFDPWWNPAVENQAIDRTHRIGQTQKVIAYRLLIKDSIEEKIRALQKTKSSLANDVLGEEKFSQSLSLDDLRYLLEG